MAAPYSNLRSKLDRAIVAYLKSQLPAGTKIYAANESDERGLPNVTVHSHRGRPDLQFTGSFRFIVQIEIHFPARNQPGNPNPSWNRVSLDALTGQTIDSLLQTDNQTNLSATAQLITDAGRALATAGGAQDQSNNADMAEFKCRWWQETGVDGGQARVADDNAGHWIEIAMFEAIADSSEGD